MKVVTHICDRCQKPVEDFSVLVHAVLITGVTPVIHRVKLDLCKACAEALAVHNQTFLAVAPAEVS